MPTNFPTSVDNFTNPTANDSLNLPSHSTQHANANDAIEAIEGYLLNGGQGLTLVKKQTIGSAVSSVTVTGAFSATYENYQIVVSGGVTNTSDTMNLKLGATTSGYKWNMIYNAFGGGVVAVASSASGTFFDYVGTGVANNINANISVMSPFATKGTFVTAQWISANEAGNTRGILNNTTSYTDFTLGVSSNMTGGTIYVYGYGLGQ